mmetsp:Transcript_5640/g.11841  ORF Transcript_5640/g.11841 Transcript_5640/m.11841 type:complete len:217 (+) Transcript_5640:2538-3188(+)
MLVDDGVAAIGDGASGSISWIHHGHAFSIVSKFWLPETCPKDSRSFVEIPDHLLVRGVTAPLFQFLTSKIWTPGEETMFPSLVLQKAGGGVIGPLLSDLILSVAFLEGDIQPIIILRRYGHTNFGIETVLEGVANNERSVARASDVTAADDCSPGDLDVLVEFPAPEVISGTSVLVLNDTRASGSQIVKEGMRQADGLIGRGVPVAPAHIIRVVTG